MQAQVAPVNPSTLVTLETLATLATSTAQVLPEAPVSQERRMVQPVAFPRLSGHPRHQGLVEMQHPRLEVRVISCFSCILFEEPWRAGWPGDGLEVVWGGLAGDFFTVPFPSPVEAEIAHWFLTPNVELQGPVQEEFSVNGSVLAVSVLQWAGEGLVAGGQSQSPPSRLTAEDPGQLRTSIASCLDQLFLVMQAMQCFVPPSFAQPQQGKGG
ncbi:hypothetical protein CB1_000342002 [Camelus ferus]|nr:hypothetical protein CB1_000342002 [Camelus ferus]